MGFWPCEHDSMVTNMTARVSGNILEPSGLMA